MRIGRRFVLAALAALAVAGCSSSDSGDGSQTHSISANASVSITAAPTGLPGIGATLTEWIDSSARRSANDPDWRGFIATDRKGCDDDLDFSEVTRPVELLLAAFHLPPKSPRRVTGLVQVDEDVSADP